MIPLPTNIVKMSLNPYVFLVVVLFLYADGASQPIFPEDGVVFNDKTVPRIDIKIHPDSLAKLLLWENKNEDHEYPADFFWNDGTNKDTILNTGFRLRGNTSRSSEKKSFKIKFNHFGSNKFYGLSDLNLNGEHNDPSIIRSKLSWDIMKMAGIEAPRSNHVALYINNEYRGLYINVEHIDNDYFEDRGKDPEGQLFKCFYGVDFVFRGNNPNSYNRDVYEAQNNKDAPDYYTLMEFIRALDDISNPDFRCRLEEKFDVDQYLKRLTIEILLGHWDNPVYNKNNAYLYHNPTTKKYELLSYDIDNTFGIDWFNINWAERNIYSWAHPSDPRPIYNHLMKVPEYKIRFGYYIKKFVDKFFNPTFLNPYIDKIKNKISPYRGNDVYASYDYGYSYFDFLQSYDQATGVHVKNGLKEYISLRSASAKSQLQNTNIAPVIEHEHVVWNNSSCTINCTVTALSQSTTTAYHRLNGGSWFSMSLSDNGIYPDQEAGDGIYTYSFLYDGKVTAEIYLTAKDVSGRESRWPVCDYHQVNLGYENVATLVVNEFMADNTTIKDNAGEYEDWIEIYNGGPSSVYLGDKFLTDKPDNPDKWQLPFTDLEPGQFLLIWADEDQEQGDHHANFKLSKSGEFLGIFDSKENNYAPIDTFSFGATVTDKTYGRYPDGLGPVLPLNKATPGISNVISSLEDTSKSTSTVFPNPVLDEINITHLQAGDKLTISDVNGLSMRQWSVFHSGLDKFSVSDFKSGIYLLTIKRHLVLQTFRFVKI